MFQRWPCNHPGVDGVFVAGLGEVGGGCLWGWCTYCGGGVLVLGGGCLWEGGLLWGEGGLGQVGGLFWGGACGGGDVSVVGEGEAYPLSSPCFTQTWESEGVCRAWSLKGPWTLAARVEDSTPCIAWEREVWKTDSGGRWPAFGGWGRAVFRPAESNCMKGSICGRFWEAGWGSARGLLWVLLCNFDLNWTCKRESLLAEKTLASWSCEKSFRHTDCARVIELPYGYPWYWGRPDHRWVCCVVCLPAGWLHEKGWGWEVDACHLCYANQFKAVCVIYILLCSFFGPKLLSRLNGAMFPVRFLWQFSSVFFYCFLPWHIIQHCGCEISVAFFSPVFMSCSISLWWLWFTDDSLSSGVVYRCYMNTDRKWKCYCKPTSASLLPLHRDCAGRGDSFASSFSICTFFVPPAYSWVFFFVFFFGGAWRG